MTPAKKRLLNTVITLGMLAVLVYYARTVHWAAAWREIRSASPSVLHLAALAGLVTLAAKGFTWWLFLRPSGSPSLGLAMRATAAGAGLNNLLVANGGDAARVVLVTRNSEASTTSVLAALALERLFDLIGYVLLLIGAAFSLPLPHDLERWRPAAIGVLAAIVLGLVALLARAPRVHARETVGRGLVARGLAALEHFIERLAFMVTVRRVVIALLLTIVNWGAQLISYHLTAVAAHFPISIGGSVTVLLAVNVGFFVRATPGNVGVFQLVYGVTAQALGLNRDSAVAVALLLQLIQNLPVTILAIAIAPDLLLHWRERRGTMVSDGTHHRRATDRAT